MSAAASAGESFPHVPNNAGKVLTVSGPVDPSSLGQTLMHEHIFIDYKRLLDDTPQFAAREAAELYERTLTMGTLYEAHYGKSLRERKFIGDPETSRDEIMEFKQRGGGSIVDLTNMGLGRDPSALLRVSQETGLLIVMGAGWYARDYHPPNMDELTVEGMTRTIVNDIVVGAEGTTIRSGIIGEVGVDGNPLTRNELKSVRASARASRITGAPISFHRGGVGEEKMRVLDILESEGVDLTRVTMGHSNSIAGDLAFMKRLLDRGVFIEFDYLGLYGPPGSVMTMRSEEVLLRAIVELIGAGYGDRIVLGHDICAKQQLKKYGGTGYYYISDFFLPALRRMSVSDSDVYKIMVDNPRRALTFGEPQQPSLVHVEN